MGPYRNPPSVRFGDFPTSTHMSEYSNLLSPGKDEFEALDYENNAQMPQKVTGRRNTKRRTCGGKDVKRLQSRRKNTERVRWGNRIHQRARAMVVCPGFSTWNTKRIIVSLKPLSPSYSAYLSNVYAYDFNAELITLLFICSTRGMVEYAEERGKMVPSQSGFLIRQGKIFIIGTKLISFRLSLSFRRQQYYTSRQFG